MKRIALCRAVIGPDHCAVRSAGLAGVVPAGVKTAGGSYPDGTGCLEAQRSGWMIGWHGAVSLTTGLRHPLSAELLEHSTQNSSLTDKQLLVTRNCMSVRRSMVEGVVNSQPMTRKGNGLQAMPISVP